MEKILKDFSYSQGLVIRHYPDEIVIENPGLLRLSKEEVLEGGHSDPRNATIQKLLAFLNYGERAGSGYPLMEAARKKYGLPNLTLAEKESPNRVLLIIPTDKKEAEEKQRLEEKEEMLNKMKETFGSSSFTRKDIRSLFGIRETKATLFLKELKKEGKIHLAPLSKAWNYVLTEED